MTTRLNRPESSVFQNGRNVWRVESATRMAFLVDGDAFFHAFVDAASRARRRIFILGWETDSRMRLPWKSESESKSLIELLQDLVEDRPELHIYVLSWDYSVIYLFEREIFPTLKFNRSSSFRDSGGRLRFVLDREHPAFASHHQKLIVIDDQVAFSGGFDLTQRRWDTREHRAVDWRRLDPEGVVYGPFHDVQICVEGEVAIALGELARARWRAATGEKVAMVPYSFSTAWPASIDPDACDVDVAISRTIPSSIQGVNQRRPKCEIEKLFVDMIRHARKFVYIENQYFTSPRLAHEIARRLREPFGPEFVMILPRDQTGWIEESTMGLLRAAALKTVKEGDRFNRFRCYFPTVPDLGSGYVKVHSKVMIVDDRIVRIGSANMNNRSLGLDTECDLTMEAADREDVASAIREFRNGLLAEHLGTSPQQFQTSFDLFGKLVPTVESFIGGPRTLVRMRPQVQPWISRIAPPREWIDPRSPQGIRRWFARRLRPRFLSEHQSSSLPGFLLVGGAALFLMSLISLTVLSQDEGSAQSMAAASDWVRWYRELDARSVAEAFERFRASPWSLPGALVGFVIGALFFVPITILIVGAVLAFPGGVGAALALSGAMISSVLVYLAGRYWAWSKSRFLRQPRVRLLAKKIRSGGTGAVLLVRLMPIAPFSLVGLVAGGLRIPFTHFILGTLIGLVPGVATMSWLANGATENSEAASRLWLGLVIFAGAMMIRKLLKTRKLSPSKSGNGA